MIDALSVLVLLVFGLCAVIGFVVLAHAAVRQVNRVMTWFEQTRERMQ